MMKIKDQETRYEVYDEDNERESDYQEDDFGSLSEALDHIKDNTRGGTFTIYKVKKSRTLVKTKKQQIVPCSGGWYGGHNISKEDEENETKNPFCTRCGYKLRVYRPFCANPKYVAIKPLVNEDDVKKLVVKEKKKWWQQKIN